MLAAPRKKRIRIITIIIILSNRAIVDLNNGLDAGAAEQIVRQTSFFQPQMDLATWSTPQTNTYNCLDSIGNELENGTPTEAHLMSLSADLQALLNLL